MWICLLISWYSVVSVGIGRGHYPQWVKCHGIAVTFTLSVENLEIPNDPQGTSSGFILMHTNGGSCSLHLFTNSCLCPASSKHLSFSHDLLPIYRIINALCMHWISKWIWTLTTFHTEDVSPFNPAAKTFSWDHFLLSLFCLHWAK